ncbi:MAG: DUF7948 domain-containing protein [Armatimonadota bacterium]
MKRNCGLAQSLAGLVAVALVTLPLTRDVTTRTPPGTADRAVDAAIRGRLVAAYGRLPLHFEVNQGQSDPHVRFLARGRGYRLLLTSTEAVLMLTRTPRAAVVRMRLVGANPAPEVSGLAELLGKVNYFIGDDPTRWRTNIPTYAKVSYQAVYPGVDLVYYGNQQELEYDFVVAPEVAPNKITLAFDGVERLEVDAQGDLVLHVADGQIRMRKPLLYQEVDAGRRSVAGGYVLKGRDEVGFQVDTYDVSRALIIDPVLSYSTYLGGSDSDFGFALAVDTSRNVYVTGQTLSTDFPAPAGAFDTTPNGSTDAFVTKLNATGSLLVYSSYLGGSSNDEGRSLAVDASGSVSVTGVAGSTNFPTTVGAFDRTANGGGDAFVTKLNPAGSALVYSTYLGGSSGEAGAGIALDALGNAYVTGDTLSTNFPATVGAFATAASGGGDAFVTKLNPAGALLVYSTFLWGGARDIGFGIAVDASGSAYVTGQTVSTNFPVTPGAFDTTVTGNGDAFVTRVNPTGSTLLYSTYLGGSDVDRGFRIAADAAGNAHVTGQTASTDFPTTPGAFDTMANGSSDAFVTKLNPPGSALVYSTYLGGASVENSFQLAGIAVDAAGNAYVTGDTSSTNFPTANALQSASGGGSDAFVTKLNPVGSALVYSTYLGGSGDDFGLAIAVDAWGNAYVAGATASTNFPTTAGVFDTTANGLNDAFIARISALVTVGLYDPAAGRFFLRNSNTAGPADVAPFYGPAGMGWIPLAGDWNGDGIDTVGVYAPATGTFFLRNSNSEGPADVAFGYGAGGAGWVPLVGDWNGDGIDTVGVYDPAGGTFFLRNSNSTGVADIAFGYGLAAAGWIPLVGDWDGNGIDTVGLYNPTTNVFFLRNSNSAGPADLAFGYGPAGAGWIPLVGDWNGDGVDTVGLYNPTTSVFFLRNSNTAGPADLVFQYGPAGSGWTPRAGDWDGL